MELYIGHTKWYGFLFMQTAAHPSLAAVEREERSDCDTVLRLNCLQQR